MYWGEPDSTISFCEDKYVESDYIAEYYNTLSAVPYIIIGVIYVNTKIKEIGYVTIMLGIGTGLLHGTLRYYGQWLDELSMLTLSFFIINRIRIINKSHKISKLYLYFLIIFYFIFQNEHVVFLVIFTSMQIYTYSIIKISNKNSKTNSIIVSLYSNIFLFSTVCWICDQLFCNYVKHIYLHAVWHIGTALSLGIGLVCLMDN